MSLAHENNINELLFENENRGEGGLFMVLSNSVFLERGTAEKSKTINIISSSNSINIDAFKPLEQLSLELSEKYGRKIEVVDILQHENTYRVRSMVLGETFDDFLNGYKFNTPDYSEVHIGQKKILNEEKKRYDVFNYSLVFKTNNNKSIQKEVYDHKSISC